MISRNPITILKAHFDGKAIVLDEPFPPDLPPDTPVEVRFETPAPANGQTPDNGKNREETVLDRIAKLAVEDDDLPPDYSEEYEHYVRGTPRR